MIIVPPLIIGADYAWTHPAPDALAAWGASFACRYVSTDPSKNITLAEAQALAAVGISVVCNWETSATEAENGYAAGVSDATQALALATAAGMPEGRPIYFSVDENTTVGPNIRSYFQGVASVLPLMQIGGYGDYAIINDLLNEHLITWAWQTYAWSADQWDSRAHIRQIQNGILVGGVQVDKNQAMTADFGQWTPGGDEVTPQDIQNIVNALTPVVRTAASDAVKFELGAILGNPPTGQKQPTNLGQLANTIVAVNSSLSKTLAGIPDAVSSAVVAHIPAVSGIDASQLEAAIRQIVHDEIAGLTVNTTITPGATA